MGCGRYARWIREPAGKVEQRGERTEWEQEEGEEEGDTERGERMKRTLLLDMQGCSCWP